MSTNSLITPDISTRILTQNYKPNPYALAWQEWADENIGQLDLAVVLKLPMSSISRNHDYLKNKLGSMLNILDVRFMPNASRKHTKRIPRFVSTEYDAGVGWHAHAAFRLQLPNYGFSILPEVFETELRNTWGVMAGDTSQRFTTSEIYVERIHGRYVGYCAKRDGYDFKQGSVEERFLVPLTSLS